MRIFHQNQYSSFMRVSHQYGITFLLTNTDNGVEKQGGLYLKN